MAEYHALTHGDADLEIKVQQLEQQNYMQSMEIQRLKADVTKWQQATTILQSAQEQCIAGKSKSASVRRTTGEILKR